MDSTLVDESIDTEDNLKHVQVWGLLVDKDGKKHELRTAEVVMGRHKDCDSRFLFSDKRISAKHFRIVREIGEDQHVKAYAVDNSSNGTFVNGKRLEKGVKLPLHEGDEISLAGVQRKDNAEKDKPVEWFVFRIPRPPQQKLQPEVVAALEEPEGTQQDDELEKAFETERQLKRKPSKTSAAEAEAEKVTPPPKKSKSQLGQRSASISKGAGGGAGDVPVVVAAAAAPPSTSTAPAPAIGTAATTVPSKEAGTSKEAAAAKANLAFLEENLMCGICQDILYKCVSLIPCLHNFCAACYSDWRKRSPLCPACRDKVASVRRNHAIQSLVQTFLDANPEKKRSEAEMKEMDAKSEITDEMLRATKVKRQYDDDDDDGEGEGDEGDEEDAGDRSDSSSSYPSPRPLASPWTGPFYSPYIRPAGLPLPALAAPFMFPLPARCRECDTPRGSDGYKCPPGAAHATCSACFSSVPQRGPLSASPCATPTACDFCKRCYCDLYWGCTALNGKGALQQLKDLKLPVADGVPNTAFNANTEEIQILNNYLTAKGKTIDTVFHELLAAIDAGTIVHSSGIPVKIPVKSTNYGCIQCAKSILLELIYTYRSTMIKKNDLPAEVTSRPDCHWGKMCRTAPHNPSHAKRFNHICEQTRFA